MKNIYIHIFLVSIITGLFIVLLGNSFDRLDGIILRDNQKNFYEEIRVVKESNKNLRNEVNELNASLDGLNDQNSVLDIIDEEIVKYKKLSGIVPIFGSGAVVTLNGEVESDWIVDLVNDFFSAGAEAVSVNNIRITNNTAGFDTLPQGQILLNSTILSQPYVFQALGDSTAMIGILNSPGNYFNRFKLSFPNVGIMAEERDFIKID